jgi:hypothetical protein
MKAMHYGKKIKSIVPSYLIPTETRANVADKINSSRQSRNLTNPQKKNIEKELMDNSVLTINNIKIGGAEGIYSDTACDHCQLNP